MPATLQKPTLRELRTEAERLGIDTITEELLRTARNNEDPFEYLLRHAMISEGKVEAAETIQPNTETIGEKTETLENEAEPIGDVPAPHTLDANPPVIFARMSVPLSGVNLDGCYISQHADVRLSHDQSITLRRLHLALDSAGMKLFNGRRIATTADAVRWLLEQIGTSPLSKQ